jgi:hypothetical protein
MSAAPTTVVGVGAAKPLAVMRDADTTTVSVSCAWTAEANIPAITKVLADVRAKNRMALRAMAVFGLYCIYSSLIVFLLGNFRETPYSEFCVAYPKTLPHIFLSVPLHSQLSQAPAPLIHPMQFIDTPIGYPHVHGGSRPI